MDFTICPTVLVGGGIAYVSITIFQTRLHLIGGQADGRIDFPGRYFRPGYELLFIILMFFSYIRQLDMFHRHRSFSGCFLELSRESFVFSVIITRKNQASYIHFTTFV